MYKPIDKLQYSFLDFNQPMRLHMNPDNRWIKMADCIPWDEFEIKYAGRRIEDYAGKIVDKANEFICLTRPYNLLTKDNKVFTSLECTNEEFENNIHKIIEENKREIFKDTKDKSLDEIAKADAKLNPFNFNS